MAKFLGRPKITMNASFTVDEEELRALDALAGYGDDAFIKHFYAKLGESYMRPHEAGLRKFLCSIREQVPSHLAVLKRAREVSDPRV